MPRAHYAAADTEAYAQRIEAQLDQGILPVEVMTSAADEAVLGALFEVMVGWPVSNITMAWAQGWVGELKRVDNLAP